MPFLKKAIKAGIAAKLVQEARKPHNQAKIKNMVQSFKNRNDRHGAPKPRSTGYR
jgi:hypothetical protein